MIGGMSMKSERAIGLPLSLALPAVVLSVVMAACGGAAPASPGGAEGASAGLAPAAGATPSSAAAPAPVVAPSPPEAVQAIRAAVADPARPADDRALDADRKPAEVLTFFGIAPGMKVADLMAGRGYYTEILARLVGPEGRVYSQNNGFVRKNVVKSALSERLARPGMDRAVEVDRELGDLGFAPGSLDAALMILFYHDTVWMGLDRPAMLGQIYGALRPGGVFGIVDHRAAPGSGVGVVQTLHRIDEEVVKREVIAAGFVLDGESELLRQPGDDHSKNVFDPAIRRKTDRFILRFRKP